MTGERSGDLSEAGDAITGTLIEKFARLALSNIDQEFPNYTGHLMRTAGDQGPRPSDMHPTFFGSFDWHSSVHMHWLLVRTLRHGGLDSGLRDRVVQALSHHLTSEKLRVEAEYLRLDPSFEQPYGRSWLLLLQAECRVLREQNPDGALAEVAANWDDALSEVTEALNASVRHLLSRTPLPIRHGVHGNSAFALILLRAAGGVLDPDIQDGVDASAVKWFGKDRDAPMHVEPSGHDFLSPVLSEAYLMSRVLSGVAFGTWFTGFIKPESIVDGLENGAWLDPPEVRDASDGQQGHLYGLALTRAWQLPQIVAALPAETGVLYRDYFMEASRRNLDFGLASLSADSNFTHDHWLATFAYLACVRPI